MPVPTLASMAIRACGRNVAGITDVADMPYDILKPILKKIQNPDQLHEIETNSPHIADSDSELWRAFIARDIPNWQAKILEPKNPRSWWKVYRKLVKDEKAAQAEQEEKLRAAMSGLSKKREENKATFVEKVVPMKAKERAFVDGVRNPHTDGWGREKHPALKNAKRAKDVMSAIRNQAKQAARDRTMNSARPAPPKKLSEAERSKLPKWISEERKPPPKMIAPAVRVPEMTVARRSSPSKMETALVNAEKEAKLRVLTQAQKKSASPPAAAQARPIGGSRTAESISDREARLRALTQPKPRTPTTTSPPEEASHPAKIPVAPRAQPAPPAPTSRSAPRPVSRPASPAIAQGAKNRPMSSGSPASRPSPVPEVLRKRPAPTSSPLMPPKRRKV